MQRRIQGGGGGGGGKGGNCTPPFEKEGASFNQL